MQKENSAVRDFAKAKGVPHWRIAAHLGVSEATFLRWLRIPLSHEKETAILQAIEELSKEEI